MIKLRPYQQRLVDKIRQAWQRVGAVLAVLPTGGGKCLGEGTPVLMYDGRIKKVENIRTGEKLMGPDSKPRTVLSVCSGRETLYRVTPVKGDPYVVNESHILSLKQTGIKSVPTYRCQEGKGDVVNISVLDYLASSATFKHTHKGWRTGVNWRGKQLNPDLPPYMLGLWLGDGSSRTPSITNADPEIVQEIYTYAAPRDLEVRVEDLPNNAAKTYHIKGTGRWYSGFGGALRQEGVLNDKHVPHTYLTTTRHGRLELLAGLIDSDGALTKTGYDITFKSFMLARDTAFLARSLGLAAYISTRKIRRGTYYRISISGDCNAIPVRVPRKKAPKRRQIKNVLVTGITVEPIGVGNYYGFEIDGDRLFMLGDFTVTHNTVIFSSIMHDHNGAAAAVVHRKEIVGQISLSLALLEVKHRIIAPPNVVSMIRKKHLKKLGRSFIDPHALAGVISVQTLTSRATQNNREMRRWLEQITLAVFDEGHHYIQTGLWARAVEVMANAKLLFVTATPDRADGKGLGAHASGFAGEMVEGPSMQWLIDHGYLSPFSYKAPATDLDVEGLAVTASGDFNAKALRARVVESHLVGDIVQHYQKYAPGRRAIVFATDVATAGELAEAFNAAGIPSAALSGETDQAIRDRELEQFEAGRLTVLVNVDLFDEGFDVPAVEAVLLARPTESLAKFLQMIGRGLRVMDGKTEAVIIDPVRNWERHGMPNWPRRWSLDGRQASGRSRREGLVPQVVCVECTQPYEAFYKACPYCGNVPAPAGRAHPRQVDGDLMELDVEALAALFAQMNAADMDDDQYALDQIARHIPAMGRPADMRRHREAKYRRRVLRELVAWWVGMQPQGRSMAEKHRRFYHRFGIDIGTAFTLNAKDTDALIGVIQQRFTEDMT